MDDEGKLVISTREGAYKTRNLRRDPTVVLCVLSDHFFGRWMQIEGTAEIVSLPEAMEGRVYYYRRISGEHPDRADYRHAMDQQQRVLVRVSIDAAGPTTLGSLSRGPRSREAAAIRCGDRMEGEPMASEDFAPQTRPADAASAVGT